MITTDHELDQALDQLGGMYRALAALRKDVLPKNRQWFHLMVEGPLDEIRKLQSQIDAYIGFAEAATDDAPESASAEIQAHAGSIDS